MRSLRANEALGQYNTQKLRPKTRHQDQADFNGIPFSAGQINNKYGKQNRQQELLVQVK